MYSAQEVSDILKNKNKEISKRTVNYYAFEKKMFEVGGGRNCFTDEDINKIENILLLREKTSYTLEQIKTIINTKSDDEIKRMFKKKEVVKTIIIDPEGEYRSMAEKIGGKYINNVSDVVNPLEINEENSIFNFEGVIDRIFNEIEPFINSSYEMSNDLYLDLNSTANLSDNTRNIIKKYKKGDKK